MSLVKNGIAIFMSVDGKHSGLMTSVYQQWEPRVHAWTIVQPSLLDSGFAVGIKDVINTAEFSTQMGSPIWKGFKPGNDARVVTKLKLAGCSVPGKTVSAEFAVHYPGGCRNPHDLSRTPGTSSSGSAVAVACGMVPAALGTQTAGSIIRPASWCGVYAMKPSFGLIPRTGILKTADTLDTVGFFTDTPERLRTMLDICRVDGPDYPFTKNLTKPRKLKSVGFVCPPCVADWPLHALKAFQNWLARLSEFMAVKEQPWELEAAYVTHRTLYHKSLSYYFKQEIQDGRISDIFKSQVAEGQAITLEQYQAALARQTELATLADAMLSKTSILVTLSSGGEAPLFGREQDAPRDTNLVWTLCGVPVINVPVFVSPDGLPFGVSIIARKYHDYKLFQFLDVLIKADLAPAGPNPKL